MRYLKSHLVLLVLAVGLMGCDGLGAPELDVQTFNLDHRSGYEAAELIGPYVFADRAENPGDMSATDAAITVRESRDNLDKISRVLEEFDTPVPTARLRFQLIEADSFQDEDPAIAEVVGELRKLFRFEGYRLIGDALVAISEDGEFTQPFLGVGEGPAENTFVAGSAQYRGRGPVRLNGIQLYIGSGLVMETSVNASIGQTLVMGASSEMGGRTLILTVRAETN
jgi:hypothetical protein